MMNRLTNLFILSLVLIIAASSNAVSLIQTSGNLSNKSYSIDNPVSLEGTDLTGDIYGSSEFQLVPTQSTGWIWIYQIEGESDFTQLSSSSSQLESAESSDNILFPSSGDVLPTVIIDGAGTHTQQSAAAAVPEPGTYLMFGLGLVLMGLIVSRKLKTQSAT